MAKANNTQLTAVPVEFGSFSGNKGTARIAMKFSPAHLSIAKAQKLFVNAQLRVTLVSDPNADDDVDGQATMEHAESASMDGIASVAGFGAREDKVTASLVFQRTAVNIEDLAACSCTSGTFTCERIGDANVADEEASK